MSNSSLVVFSKISPNKTSPRNHVIDTITIHCVVGQCSAETLGDLFANPKRKASSNYGVDKDGRIGLYVDESDRSWCSSDPANDNRAITIEVASDTTHPYAVNDKAFAALLDLVTDICKRNNINKLVWSDNKDDRVNHRNGCNMTCHRDYANKACPGQYLYEREGLIALEVNKRLAGNINNNKIKDDMSSKEIFDFFLKLGLTPEGVAGLMGNLQAESGLRSNNLQNSYEKSLGMTDEQYISAVESGVYSKSLFVNDKAGFGLAQWTYSTRKEALYNYAQRVGHTIDSCRMQCEFLYQELSSHYKSVLDVLTTSKNIRECSNAVLLNFEKPRDQSQKVHDQRYVYSQSIYNSCYTGDVEVYKPYKTVPFLVKVKISDLNIRELPDYKSKSHGYIPVGVYTIVDIQNECWGKLKSGQGWINLKYTESL